MDSQKGLALPAGVAGGATVYPVLLAISFCHFLNDLLQAVLPAIYPLVKEAFALSFTEIGLITLTAQVTASLLQPVVGLYTDRHPKPYSLAFGMASTLAGMTLLALADSFGMLLAAAALTGVGSSVFHPESSRVARMASGGQFGLAQSVFQVGGNLGSAAGPLLAALVILPRGLGAAGWFSFAALIALVVLWRVGVWYKARQKPRGVAIPSHPAVPPLPSRRVAKAVAVLLALIFSKYFYIASLTSYYTFYLIHRFGVSVGQSQVLLFVFLGAVAAGTIVGGPVGDRIGRKRVIWFSIAGVLPFTLALPHVGLTATVILTVVIGLVIASAFAAILVYAQELMPGHVGAVAGFFFGFAFGMGGLGAAVLGKLADATSIEFVYLVCSFLPAIGFLAWLLPDVETDRRAKKA